MSHNASSNKELREVSRGFSTEKSHYLLQEGMYDIVGSICTGHPDKLVCRDDFVYGLWV